MRTLHMPVFRPVRRLRQHNGEIKGGPTIVTPTECHYTSFKEENGIPLRNDINSFY